MKSYFSIKFHLVLPYLTHLQIEIKEFIRIMSSINAILTQRGKNLQPGQTITFTLVKGGTTSSSDPILQSKTPNASNNDNNSLNQKFPCIAKFGESVVKPNFSTPNHFRDGRMFEENKPKARDDSDDEDNDLTGGSSNNDDGDVGGQAPKRRKKKWKRKQPERRHWIICEEKDYQAKKRSKNNEFPPGGSYRYEGSPEFNSSSYVLLSVKNNNEDGNINGHGTSSLGLPQVEVLPVNGFLSFTQPARTPNMSMQDVELSIQSRRSVFNPMKQKSSKSRLIGKLAGVSDQPQKAGTYGRVALTMDDEDDVMGDVAYRNSTKMNKSSRAELLSSMADEGVLVNDEGVLGGANDSEFGGKARFSAFSSGKSNKDGQRNANMSKKKKASLQNEGSKTIATFDGGAMADDFYQRDVSAEYEDLDFDPNDQFDNDDQDMGQSEETNNHGGFDRDGEDDDNDEYDDDDDGDDGERGSLATAAGYRAFMAKARGEVVDTDANGAVGNTSNGSPTDANGKKTTAYNRADVTNKTENNKMSSEKSNDAPANSHTSQPSSQERLPHGIKNTSANKKSGKNTKGGSGQTGVALDKQGDRLITVETVRREIWLHNQQIQLKKLAKIFNVNNSSKRERREKFKECVKELCILSDDLIEGKICRLKQHYSNMG